jgi:alpha-2-macroglobulin
MNPQSVSLPRPPRVTGSRWWLAALLVSALSGCKGEPQNPPSTPSSPSTPASGTDSSSTGSTPARAAPKAEALTPTLHDLGAEGQLPREVVMEFPRAVAPEDTQVRKGTVLRMSPDAPGTLSYRGASTLVFTPRAPLAFNTRYTATLEALELGDGTVLKPEKQGAWRHEFTTPGFAFLRLSPRQVDVGKGKIETDLIFSGPVDVANVRRLSSFTVDGKPVSDVKLRTQPEDPFTVTATLTGASLRPGAEVTFSLKAGLAAAGQGKTEPAPAGSGTFTLHVGKRLDFTNAYVQEGATGHFIEVRCRERNSGDAPSHAEGEEDYDYYGNQGTRCSLDEDSADASVHFNPPVKFSVSPSRWGFRILGDFKRGTYAMRIDAGAPWPRRAAPMAWRS